MPPANYKQILKAGNRPGHEFRIVVGNRENLRHCLLVAPHGGGIEPMTSQITVAIAGVSCRAYYLFEGLLQRRNWGMLHMDSTTFDEPEFVALVQEADYVITFHGAERDRTRTIYVGGLHEEGRRLVIEALKGDLNEYGITAVDATRSADAQTIAGVNPHNLTNRGRMGQGVQLEFSRGARLVFFPGESRTHRQRPNANLGVLARSIDRALRELTGFPASNQK
ncbi:MAG: poly-gamma-glutamate hydrolase family protein [Terriglobales bacterium]